MDRARLESEVVAAAQAWAAAKRAWEATSRVVSRPANLSELKGNVRRAERALMAKIDALAASGGPNGGDDSDGTPGG